MPERILSFDEFLVKLRDSATSNRDQGTKFEIAMAALLPELKDFEFDKAWLWADWPQRENITGLNAQDVGIDIVARIRDSNEYWAVQCKFYDPDSTISQADLGTFFTVSGQEGFSGRLIITTTDNWTSNAEGRLKNQQIETHRLRLKDLRSLNIGWNWVRPDRTRVLPDKERPLHRRQQEALKAALKHYEENDRGQLIMACGTGKTFTSLKITEELVPKNGSVLFVVPSLSLMKQGITEWAWHSKRECNFLGICSDQTVGQQGEDATHVADITVPVKTNPGSIASHLKSKTSSERMTVVFCTYQSLDRLSIAQQSGAPEFDLVICDEAHRTTGVDREGQSGSGKNNSNFVMVHEQKFIKGRKRLYMTATPRIYTEAAQAKAAEHDLGVYTMNDEGQFGREFYRLGFSKAVDDGLLSDYRVIVLNIDQGYVTSLISKLDKDVIAELDPTTDDAAKIIGCYKGLRSQDKNQGGTMLKRAVSFSSSIKNSKLVVEKFSKVVQQLDAMENDGFTCELDHVDGKQTALDRAQKLDWLKADAPTNDDGQVCRILSNAQCLTEGVDVPSLDAVLFMNPRRSQVDVVQAVGRVMRKARGKGYGYVILPVVIPEGVDINDALDNNETYAVVWEVLRALRAHDDRLTNAISKLELNNKKPDVVGVGGIGFGEDGEGQAASTAEAANIQLEFGFPEELAGLIYAKIVDKVGDKRYLEQWAKDTAELHDLLVSRIDKLRADKVEVAKVYDEFLASIHASIHDGLDESDASSMLAQQLITSPVFDALFENYEFSQNNVVSSSLNAVLKRIKEYGLEAELTPLQQFYDSVSERIAGIDNDEGKQRVITELYEKFFTTAFPKTSASFGIAYTPMELVDFTLHSANEVMQSEFGRGLGDEGVHIIDPFTGTGSFIVRLLSSPKLVGDSDLQRKFTSELWANEILLLAYYIASVNIEMAYFDRGERKYESFPGISLTDTFELNENEQQQIPEMLEGNSDRINAQLNAPIRVIVGNPPWSTGQRSENDNNANRDYPKLDESIQGSYADKSSANNLNALYDSYIRAIRWASDRIGDEGIVAFVTNGGWLDGASTDGMRLCIEEEFDAVWLFNLRGNARLKGEAWRREGDKIFGQASRAPVLISLFIKNPSNRRPKAEIRYSDIGDYKKRDEKLEIIRKAGSVSRLQWKTITPNSEGDWVNQRDPLFQTFIELGNDEVKRGRALIPDTIFYSFSNGLKSNRDAWVYNFSREKVASNMTRMIEKYNEQVTQLAAARKKNPNIKTNDVLDMDPTSISWGGSLKNYAERGLKGYFDEERIVPSLYRPFTMKHLYFDPQFIERSYRLTSYFPTPQSKNQLICVSGKGASDDFGCMMTDTVPSNHTLDTGQAFPRWVYQKNETTGEFERDDNITDHVLDLFKEHYENDRITKDDIFDYVYGVLHAPDYRESFATDLRLSLPRIPMADDFRAFANAGAELAVLHLNWPEPQRSSKAGELSIFYNGEAPSFLELIPENAFSVSRMSWSESGDDKYINYNKQIKIGPIPKEALIYTIGGQTPLKWITDRFLVKPDTASGIINDPNDWIAEQKDELGGLQPDALFQHIKRITHLSIETKRIIDNLPNAIEKK